jgi:hypothetical protein
MSTVTIAQFKDESLNITYKLLQTGDSYQIRRKFVSNYDSKSWSHEIESFSTAQDAMDSWKIKVSVNQNNPKCSPQLFEAAQVAFDKANIYLFGNEENVKSQDEVT